MGKMKKIKDLIRISYKVCFLLTLLLLSNTVVQAATLYYSGGFSKASALKYYASGSTTYASTAVAQWNGVSSKVKISKVSSSSDSNILISCNNIESPSPGVLGKTSLVKDGKLVSTSSTWDHATCIQYKSDDLKTTNNKIATATHELGHALSLKENNNNVYEDVPVMSQGVKSSYKLTAADKSALKQKWGN